MKIINVEQDTDEWLLARKGKITGSKLNDIVVKRGTGKKIGFYELIADRLAIESDTENPMDRGHRLEEEAIALFERQEGKKFNRGVFAVSDDNENIAISHDGLSEDETYAIEVKCLSSAKHLQALIEQQIPSEYDMQKLQYFIVNPKLQTLYFVFYDPRILSKPLHYITFFREDLEEDIKMYTDYQVQTLKEVNELLEKLAF